MYSHCFNLLKFYCKYLSIVLSFISYFFGENKLVYSNKLLPFIIKPMNPIQKYPYIIKSHACILKIIFVTFLLPMNFLFSFAIYSTLKLAKHVSQIITTHIQSYQMNSHWFIHIRIKYKYLILCFTWIISWTKTIKSRFVFIIFLYFKIT